MKLREAVETYHEKLMAMKEEVKRFIFGQDHAIEGVIKAIICNGHVLLEGVPGTAKTVMLLTIARTIEGAKFSRIQFTPDLLPSDITGITIYREETKSFEVQLGPIFANIVLADEINRTPPKVQSAMLEAMQERQVTIGKKTFKLPEPFFVIATQNPLEQQGTYPLGEAQKDRFIFKVLVGYPKEEEEEKIIDVNMNVKRMSEFGIEQVVTTKEILAMQEAVKKIYSSDEIKEYILNIVEATRYPEKYGIKTGRYIRWGASPRASIFLNLAAKANALFNGRDFVIPEDVIEIAPHVLRHRIILNYEGRAKGIKTDEIVEEILRKVEIV